VVFVQKKEKKGEIKRTERAEEKGGGKKVAFLYEGNQNPEAV